MRRTYGRTTSVCAFKQTTNVMGAWVGSVVCKWAGWVSLWCVGMGGWVDLWNGWMGGFIHGYSNGNVVR
jgi:hypothetical protein